ncbi:MAG: hypothetical protein FJ115_14350 [Deltaproteobacteria bacterium]|nr:hypothetical protein [Deltaproteobacteria bacterium]
MDGNLDQNNPKLVRSDSLIVDLSSMEEGLLEKKRYQQEVWEYIEYRESLIKWPPMNEQIRGGVR